MGALSTLAALAGIAGCGDDASSNVHGNDDHHDPGARETVATPVFDRAPGTFTSAQKVAISSATPGATIHYTLDGSTPGATSAVYGAPLDIGKTTTIKAIALEAGFNDSAVQSGTYIIDIPVETVVCNGNFFAKNRAGLEALLHCREITGTLEVVDVDGGDLAPLAHLQRVGGDLKIIYHFSLRSLHGLEALTSVGGSLTVSENKALTSIDALGALQTVGGSLSVDGNALTEWIGPSTLTKVGGLSIAREEKLRHIGGFSALTEIAGRLDVSYNPVLTTFDGVPVLTTIRADVSLNENSALTDLPTLPQVHELGGLFILHNYALKRFPLFPGLTAIHGGLTMAFSPISSLELRNVTTVDDDLLIQGALSSLDGLSGLSGLTKVGGNITIDSTDLAGLTGLEKLTTARSLRVSNNTSLRNLRGLEKLETLTSSSSDSETVAIVHNNVLTEIGGLDGLTQASGIVRVNFNPALTQLNGLRRLQSADVLQLLDNVALTQLNGLDALAHTTGKVAIEGNALTSIEELHALTKVDGLVHIKEASLASLAGLRALASIGQGLDITACAALSDLTGLDALRSIGGDLTVSSNPKLTRVDTLTQLTTFSGSKLAITANTALPACQADAVDSRLAILGFRGAKDLSGNTGSGTCP